MTPERPILKYFGGKWLLAPWIISQMPPHRSYVEPFGGGASVLLRKPRVYSEVYNDLDGEIVNVFRVMQTRFDDLSHRLRNTPYSRVEYNLAWEAAGDDLERARKTLVRSHMGMGDATTGNSKTGFRAKSEHSGTSKSDNWRTWVDGIDEFRNRLMGVVIENREAKEVMAQQDGEQTLHFVDPPYIHDSRTSSNNYRIEMTDEQHSDLCEFLMSLKGMIVLSGYNHPLYERLGWSKRYKNTRSNGGNARTESLWLNPAAVKASAQQNLFEVTP